jgi:hypothetical protein
MQHEPKQVARVASLFGHRNHVARASMAELDSLPKADPPRSKSDSRAVWMETNRMAGHSIRAEKACAVELSNGQSDQEMYEL